MTPTMTEDRNNITATIVVGNGLGMALDHEYFKLSAGIESAVRGFSEDERKLIRLGLENTPSSEDELENHHLVLSACTMLKNYQKIKLDWLSEAGNNFPDLYQNFIYQVSKYFFEYEGHLPNKFIDSLCEFIAHSHCCHIATLNYDKLLYEALVKREILAGYQNRGLVDGFHNDQNGFDEDNLRRSYFNFGWYLHLHGSPVFKSDNNGLITKSNMYSLPIDANTNEDIHNHIVLANTKLKPAIISKSRLLDAYFDYFTIALAESNVIYLLGYSGNDSHVNLKIQRWINHNKGSKTFKVYIIEWKNIETEKERKDFWNKKLLTSDEQLKLIRHENILEYGFAE